jgi:Protein of unknown function (DUF1573)
MLYFVEQFQLMLSTFSFFGSSLVPIAAARNDGGFKGFTPRSFAIDSSQTEIKQYHISMHSRSVSPRIVLVRNFASLCLGVSFFFVCAAPIFAQLKWEQVEQTFAPGPLDKQVAAKYRFTNIGTAPVSIKDVRTSCGCTTAALKKWEYAPGESGEIEANFQFAGHIGHQEKWIFVTTSAAPREPTLLRLIVNIPIAVTIEPEFVMWSIGDQLAPKTIRIAVGDGFQAKIVSVQVNNPAVKLELREVRTGKEVEVTVTPPNTSKPENAVLSIRTDYPPENPQTHYAYAQVK